MEPQIRTEPSVYKKTLRERLISWVLVAGDRHLIAAGITVSIVGVVGVLIWSGIVAVGPESVVDSLFASGLTAGVITLITIALSINQLIISRVTGTVDSLTDRLNGALELHANIATLARKPSSPNDPAAFLSLVAQTLSERVSTLSTMIESGDWNPPSEVSSALRDIGEYGEDIDSHLEPTAEVAYVLTVLLGTEYAVNLRAVHHLQNKYADSLSEDVHAEFQAIEELLESIAVVRQFYKTIAIQQDLAELSRRIVYTGLIAFITTIALALIYRTNSVTIPPATLPIVVSLGIGVVSVPLSLFVSYILRVATVARETVSVGPFIPPQ